MNNKIDREFIEKLNSLDDETLRVAIKSLAQAAGVNEKQVAYAAQNIKSIKKRIAKMNEEDIEAMISRADREKADEVIDFIKKSGKAN